MMTISRLILIVLAVFLIMSNAPAENKTGDTGVTESEKTLALSTNRFGFKLFQQAATKDDGNVFISPLSVSYALAMTLNGTDGETRQAILSTLQLNGIDDPNASFKGLTAFLTGLDSLVKFEIANSIWYREGLPVNDAFIEANQDNFDALVRGLNFNSPGAADIINGWVDEKTNGKISKIVNPPIDPSTIMFLINAIYFKGDWAIKFNAGNTRSHPFYVSQGKETTCRMMFNTEKYDYFEYDLFQAIDLPYGNSDFSMTVFLPAKEITIKELIDFLDKERWTIDANFDKTEVELGLPRFKFEYEITLNDILENMGMAVAFDSHKADFRKMLESPAAPDRNVYIDQVLHKTFLQVDEKGTEAAAVTSVRLALTSAAPMAKPVMIVDRPFLFGIREKTSGSFIFVGKVTDPVWED